MNIKITGTGSYIPEIVQDNSKFLDRNFFDNEGNRIETKNEEIIEKFQKITGIRERRYAKDELNTSDIAYLAAKEAIKNSKVDPEKIDYIILAHNFGNASNNSTQVDVFPSLAVRVKNLLKIKNPKCVAYDILFGCPGWLEGVIQGYGFIKAGMAERCLVIGADTLSRVVDVNDRDSMIFADGAGATIIEKTDEEGGILSHNTASYTDDEVFYLFYGKSYNPQADEKTTRKFGGTGLGLTITKMFAEMMGGGINLSSKINEGTTFIVSVPKVVIDPKKIKDQIHKVDKKISFRLKNDFSDYF